MTGGISRDAEWQGLRKVPLVSGKLYASRAHTRKSQTICGNSVGASMSHNNNDASNTLL